MSKKSWQWRLGTRLGGKASNGVELKLIPVCMTLYACVYVHGVILLRKISVLA